MVKSKTKAGAAPRAAPVGAPEAIVPSNLVLDETIPNISADPSEEDKVAWRESAKLDVQSLMLDPESVKARCLSMALTDYVMNEKAGAAYFGELLQDLRLSAPGEKPLMAAVTISTRLDRGDIASGKKAATILDEMASAGQSLLKLARDRAVQFAYTQQCVAELRQIISEYGYRALADRSRNEDIENKERGVIKLDAAKVNTIAAERISKKLSLQERSSIALAARDSTGKLVELPNLSLSQTALTAALMNAELGDDLVLDLWELCQAADGIAVETTSRMKVQGADPADRKAERRMTEAHVVRRSDGTIVIGAYGAQASNVLHIAGFKGLLNVEPPYDVMMPPQVRKKLALNLAKVAQRNSVQAKEEPPAPGTSSIYATYKLRSEAAIAPAYGPEGKGLSFSWFLPTYGAKGDPDDRVVDVRQDRTWRNIATIPNLQAINFCALMSAAADGFGSAAKKRKSAPLRVDAQQLILRIPAIGEERKFAVTQHEPLSVYVAAADLRSALQMMAGLQVKGTLDLCIDANAKALRWTFAHRGHEYRLYMPCSGEAGERLTDAYQSLSVTRPEAAETKLAA